jgi:hypothetical protein
VCSSPAPRWSRFLVHVPGQMNGNLVIMEVKSALGVRNEGYVSDDLLKLTTFVASKQYERGLYRLRW